MYVALSVAASLAFAVGGLFMKYSDGLTRLAPTGAVFLLFCLGAACQATAMKRAEMGVVYLFVLGLESVAAFLLSVIVLRESVTPGKIAAVVLIAAGITLLHRT